MPEGRRPRGVTPRQRSGAAAESTRLRRRRSSRAELPCVRGRGRGRPRGDTQRLRSGAVAGRSYLPHAPTPEARGGGREDQPLVQGAVDARAQEGLEELSHVEGQKGRR